MVSTNPFIFPASTSMSSSYSSLELTCSVDMQDVVVVVAAMDF
jgi:hypothetical protein